VFTCQQMLVLVLRLVVLELAAQRVGVIQAPLVEAGETARL
jgi:hypothetical protein